MVVADPNTAGEFTCQFQIADVLGRVAHEQAQLLPADEAIVRLSSSSVTTGHVSTFDCTPPDVPAAQPN